MRVFKTKPFCKWAEKEGLDNDSLQKAISEMERGLNDADLGGHVYKKRVALQKRGKSGGARTIIAFELKNRAFFMYGFAKNKRANISTKELRTLKLLAMHLGMRHLLKYQPRLPFCPCFSPPLWLHSSLCARRGNKNHKQKFCTSWYFNFCLIPY